MSGYFVFALLLPSFVVPQASHCYRCFGSNWCNNFTDPSFAQNVDEVECRTANTYSRQGNNPFTQSLLDSLKIVVETNNEQENDEGSLMGCVTATIHEAHEDHTVRVCINQASIICPTIRNGVLSNVNYISPDVRFSCSGCTSSFCNTHTFVEDDLATTSPLSTDLPTSSLSISDPSSPSTDLPTSSSSPSPDSSTATSESSSLSSESSTAISESDSSSTTSELSSKGTLVTTTELLPTTVGEEDKETTRSPGLGHIFVVSNIILLITVIVSFLI